MLLPLLLTLTAPADTTRYALHMLLFQVGTETAVTTKEGGSERMAATATWRYLGTPVELRTEMRFGGGRRAEYYKATGGTSTSTRIDYELELGGASPFVRNGEERKGVSGVDFALAGYPSPAAMDAMLRWWRNGARQPQFRVGPDRAVRMTSGGHERITLQGKSQLVERIDVVGPFWGRMITWIDGDGRLLAMVGGDAELDRFEAVREDLRGALPAFAKLALAADSVWLRGWSKPLLEAARPGLFVRNVRLIDGTGAPAQSGRSVLVRDGVVRAIGDAAMPAPADARVIDGTGMTLLPGLWDMHGHYEQAEWLPAGLAAGVTSVREAANEFAVVKGYRDWVARGLVLGPRLFPAGVIDGAGPQQLGIVTATTPDEARAAVRRYAEAGFHEIKIYQSVPPAIVPVIVAEAKAQGMPVTGHVPTGMNLLQFLDAGATQVNHFNSVAAVLRTPPPPGERARPVDTLSARADSMVKRFLEVGLVIDPSLARGEMFRVPRGGFERIEPGTACAPWSLREALASVGIADTAAATRNAAAGQANLAVVAWLMRRGVTIVLGTDLVLPGHSMHRELELAVQGGMTPLEAIRAATSLPARSLGRPALEGTIAVGAPADLLLVRGDPATRIADVRKVVSVVRDGRLLDPRLLWEAAGFRGDCR